MKLLDNIMESIYKDDLYSSDEIIGVVLNRDGYERLKAEFIDEFSLTEFEDDMLEEYIGLKISVSDKIERSFEFF